MPQPNQAMRTEAQRGLDWRNEFGRGGTEVGIARARDIVNNENLSQDTVRRMKAYFDRHEIDKEAEGFRPGEDGYPSNGRIAWALWGGDAGRSWANANLEDDSRATESGGAMKDKEIRSFVPAEMRAAEDGSVRVSGYAAVFNQETDIGGFFTEVIERGAFTEAIGRDDVVFLINHEGLPLARTRSGTLTLSEDERGLKVDAMLDMSDPDVMSIVPKMKRGDLDKMSFAFYPEAQRWDETGDVPKRYIQKVRLADVSIVTTPAYDGTEIGLRSLEAHRRSSSKAKKSSPSNQASRRMRMAAKLRGIFQPSKRSMEEEEVILQSIVSSEQNLINRQNVQDNWNLGPVEASVDPAANSDYWSNMATVWSVSEAEARRMLCSNCEYFNNTPEAQRLMEDIPLDEFDMDGGGRGYCQKFEFVCHNLRTCQAWERKEFAAD